MQIAGVATMCLQRLAAMLLQVCQNPTQPGFNHYLFESVAALIKFSAAADVSKVAELEQNLFPAFNIVLQQDVQVSVAGRSLPQTTVFHVVKMVALPSIPWGGCSPCMTWNTVHPRHATRGVVILHMPDQTSLRAPLSADLAF